jgi:hypothetical protein
MRPKTSSTSTCALLCALLCAGSAGMAAPMGGPYSCAVPRALLCEGCASQLEIKLLANGACRISFTAPSWPAEASPPVAAPVQGALTFTIEQSPAVARRSTSAHWRGPQRRPTPVAEAKAAHAKCFVFNANEYCE